MTRPAGSRRQAASSSGVVCGPSCFMATWKDGEGVTLVKGAGAAASTKASRCQRTMLVPQKKKGEMSKARLASWPSDEAPAFRRWWLWWWVGGCGVGVGLGWVWGVGGGGSSDSTE